MIQTIRPLSFSEILDEVYLAAEDTVLGRAEPRSDKADWLFALFPDDAAHEASGAEFSARASAYLEAEGETAAPLSEEERVAAELALDGAATLSDLKRIRRAFALRNHPDLFKSGLGGLANSRMKIANMLIDKRRKEIEARR